MHKSEGRGAERVGGRGEERGGSGGGGQQSYFRKTVLRGGLLRESGGKPPHSKGESWLDGVSGSHYSRLAPQRSPVI